MESEAPDRVRAGAGAGPRAAVDDDRVHEPTDPELIQLNGLLQSALTELGHKVIERLGQGSKSWQVAALSPVRRVHEAHHDERGGGGLRPRGRD